MNELPSWVLPMLGLFFGVSGPFGALLAYKSESRKAPIEHKTAQVAEATAISTTANALLQTVFDRMKIQDDRAEAQDNKIKELRNELTLTNSRLDRIKFTWASWYNDLREDWDMHRIKDDAPAPPITESL